MAGLVALGFAFSAGAGEGEEASPLDDTTLRVDAALRGTVVFESPPYGDDAFTSFFDQYRYVATEDEVVPWHLDFRRLRIAWEREDGTVPFEIRRESRGWMNERGRVLVKLPELNASLEYSRYRSGELRLYPKGTDGTSFIYGAQGIIPTFGTTFNSDLAPENPLGAGRRLSLRRNRVGGSVGLPWKEPDDSLLSTVKASAFASYEHRAGKRQDRHLVEQNTVIPENQRFRGRRRQLDQESVTAGLRATAVSAKRFTTQVELRFEGFRERANAFEYRDLAAGVSAIPLTGLPILDERTFRYVPDTNRIVASFSSSGKVRQASLRLSGHFSHLRQAGAGAPIQRLEGIGENIVNEGSVRGAWRVPLHRRLDLSGDFNARWRENRVGRRAITQSTLQSVFLLEPVQTNAYLKRRREVTARSELRFLPRRGSAVLLGFKLRDVHRKRAFGLGPSSIVDEYNLVEQTSRSFRIYAEGRQRLGRALRSEIEAGYEWAPEVGLVREAEEAAYGRVKLTAAISLPRPISLAVQGKVRHRKNDEIRLESASPDGGRRKKYSQLEWSYGATATIIGPRDIQLVSTFHHSRDEQRFDHVRSNLARHEADLSTIRFFRDSTPEFRSDLKALAVTTRVPIVDGLEARLATSVTWIDSGYLGGGPTGEILDQANRARGRILGIETGLEWTLSTWSIEAAYRFDDFDDRVDLGPLERDVSAHSGWLQISYRR
jgi:hypothetical protein